MVWLFLDGTLLWVFLLVLSVSIFGTVQAEKPGWCSFLFGAGLIGLQLFSPYHPLTFIAHNTVDSLVLLAGYAVAGIIWCIFKWMSYVHQLKDRYLEYKNEYLAENPLKTRDAYIAQYISENPLINTDRYAPQGTAPWLPSEQQIASQKTRAEEWADRQLDAADLRAQNSLGMDLPKTHSERIKFLGKHKPAIYMWISFWPFSFIGTLFDDPIRRFLRFTYARMTGVLTGITERAFKNI
jgi:hypothetical protein